jgi:hypothetical protein
VHGEADEGKGENEREWRDGNSGGVWKLGVWDRRSGSREWGRRRREGKR